MIFLISFFCVNIISFRFQHFSYFSFSLILCYPWHVLLSARVLSCLNFNFIIYILRVSVELIFGKCYFLPFCYLLLVFTSFFWVTSGARAINRILIELNMMGWLERDRKGNTYTEQIKCLANNEVFFFSNEIKQNSIDW